MNRGKSYELRRSTWRFGAWRIVSRVAFSILMLTAAQTRAEAVRLRIGVVAPLSGALAEYGGAIRHAFDLASDQKPGGVEVMWEDSRSDSAIALTAFEKLASSGVDAVVVWGTTPNEAIAPVAQSRGVPLLAMSINGSIAKGRPMIVRTGADAKHLVAPLAEYLRASNVNRISLLKTEWSYTEELAKALRESLPGVSIEELSFDRATTDFRTALAKLKFRAPDVVGVFLSTGQISSFYRQASELHLTFKSFGSDFFSGRKEIKEAGPLIEGAVFPHLGTCDTFLKRYRDRFGDDTHIAYAANAYDTATVLFKAAERTNERKQLLTTLIGETSVHGVCAPFRIENTADYGRFFDYPVDLYRIKAGAAVSLREAEGP